MRAKRGRPQGDSPYTPEQLAWMQQMQAQGYAPEQIAQMQQMEQMQGYAPEQMQQAQAWQAQGYTPEQIAQMQRAQVWQAQGYTPEQLAQMQQTQGYTPEQIAQFQQIQQAQAWQAQTWQAQGYTLEQIAQMQQMEQMQQAQAWQAQGYTPEQIAQMQQMQQAQYDAFLYQQEPPPPSVQTPPNVHAKRRRPKRVKPPRPPLSRGAKLTRAALIVVVAGVAVWFGLRTFLPAGASTAIIEMSEIGNVYAGDALVVRNETAFDEEGVQSIDYEAQEGAVVYLGDVVCYVYSTGYSTKETTALQDYRDQIKDYQRTLLQSETAYDQKMSRLESEVVNCGLEVRSLVQGARGNLINQETILDTDIRQRQTYFRSKYSSDMRLNRLYEDEKTQEQRIQSWIKQKVATEESIVSFYTDGFEYALSPTKYESYTPKQVRDMIGGKVPETSSAARGRTNLYRLVKKNNYAVLMLINDSTWNPVEGTTYKLVLEQFSNTIVDARVISATRAGGELLVRLAVIGDVTDVLYMRTCRAQLGEYVDCLSVPSSALYQQNDATGVVMITSDKQYFVPVKVLRQEGGKAYITAINTGILTEGQTVRLFH